MPEVRSQFLDGRGDNLIITFNDMGGSFANQRFWGENVFKKIGVPAYGVTCVGPNWFPQYETCKAIKEVVSHARKYRKVILYGYSMGAYAAIKYSWLFHDPIVLAFSPQVSINPEDCGTCDERYMQYFDSRYNQNMLIEELDVGGKILVFFDPSTSTEKFHAERIPGNVIRIPMYGCGHGTIHAISSSSRIKKLIDDAIHERYGTIRRDMQHYKRHATDYHRSMFFALNRLSHNTKGAWFADFIASTKVKDMEISTYRAEFYKRVGRRADAAAAYRLAYELDPQPRFLEWAEDAENIKA